MDTISGDMCRRLEQTPTDLGQLKMCPLIYRPLCLHHYHPSNSEYIKILKIIIENRITKRLDICPVLPFAECEREVSASLLDHHCMFSKQPSA